MCHAQQRSQSIHESMVGSCRSPRIHMSMCKVQVFLAVRRLKEIDEMLAKAAAASSSFRVRLHLPPSVAKVC